jgi:hypothetical protein
MCQNDSKNYYSFFIFLFLYFFELNESKNDELYFSRKYDLKHQQSAIISTVNQQSE